jgi:hypothetical protein
MNYTALAVILAILYYFGISLGRVLYDIFISQTKKLKLDINKTGTIWYIGLIFINMLILAFIISFYYYKSNYDIGIMGPSGYPGVKGLVGINEEGCAY